MPRSNSNLLAQTQLPDRQNAPDYGDLYGAVNQGAFAALIVLIGIALIGGRFLNKLVDRLIQAPWLASIPDRLEDVKALPDQVSAIATQLQDIEKQIDDLVESDREKAEHMRAALTQVLSAIEQIRREVSSK